MRHRRTFLAITSALAVVGGALVAPAVSSAAPAAAASAAAASLVTAPEGEFTPKAPTRIMDTRSGQGIANHLGAGSTATLQVSGTPAVPSNGASTVVFNLTVTNPTSSGYVTAWPAGTTRPNASNINFRRGWTGANLVTVKLSTSGKVNFFNSAGTTDLIADVVGWYADSSGATSATGAFQEVTPGRLWDTRGHAAVQGGGSLIQPVSIEDSGGTVANAHIRALAVTLTVVGPQTSGYLRAWSGAGAAPTASVLNYTAGRTVANLAIVPVAPCTDPKCGASAGLPSIKILNNSNGATNLLIDIWGFYDDGTLADGLLFKPLSTPVRIVDTRSGLGASTMFTGSKRTVLAPGTVAGAPTHVLVQNVTSIPKANTYLTLWRTGTTQPTVSNISPRAGTTVAGLAYTGVGASNDFSIYNYSATNDVLVDVAGSFEAQSAKGKAGPARTTWRAAGTG